MRSGCLRYMFFSTSSASASCSLRLMTAGRPISRIACSSRTRLTPNGIDAPLAEMPGSAVAEPRRADGHPGRAAAERASSGSSQPAPSSSRDTRRPLSVALAAAARATPRRTRHGRAGGDASQWAAWRWLAGAARRSRAIGASRGGSPTASVRAPRCVCSVQGVPSPRAGARASRAAGDSPRRPSSTEAATS